MQLEAHKNYNTYIISWSENCGFKQADIEPPLYLAVKYIKILQSWITFESDLMFPEGDPLF